MPRFVPIVSLSRGDPMKRIFFSVSMLSLVFAFSAYGHAENTKNRQTLNLDQIAGNPHSYHCAIRFKSVDGVYIRTLVSAEAAGHASEVLELGRDEWKYDASTGMFSITRDIDTSVYIPVADGRYEMPLHILLREKIDPSTIRFSIDGRIGTAEKDYTYYADRDEIILKPFVTGDENYMLQYRTIEGSSSLCQGNPSEVTREVRAYFEWPLKGNTAQVGTDGKRFALEDGKFTSVWMVELIPVKNGYKGKSLQTGFTWDSGKNELILAEPVDTTKYSVYIFGNE